MHAGDNAGVGAGQGREKRKVKGKKSKSRAAKRQAQHGDRAHSNAEQEQAAVSLGASPGSHVCGDQILTDLREAALTWAQKARAEPQ